MEVLPVPGGPKQHATRRCQTEIGDAGILNQRVDHERFERLLDFAEALEIRKLDVGDLIGVQVRGEDRILQHALECRLGNVAAGLHHGAGRSHLIRRELWRQAEQPCSVDLTRLLAEQRLQQDGEVLDLESWDMHLHAALADARHFADYG